MPSECVLESLSGRLSNLERLCDGWQEQSRIHHSGKADEPHAVWIRIDELGHSLQSQTRLPGAARTRECQQAHVLSPEQVEHLGEFAVAAEERCRLHGQVGLVEALEWRELALPELEDSLGLLQVLEPVESKVADLCVDESTSRLRKQHLAAVAAGGDARALVHVEADIALLGQDGLARVQAHANPDRARGEHVLGRPCSGDPVARPGEGDEEGVALRVHLDAPVGDEGPAQDAPMFREGIGITVAQLLQQPRRSLDVGEEEGHGA